MWNQGLQNHLQMAAASLHPQQHHFNHGQQISASQQAAAATAADPALRVKDLASWCEAFDKHELVDILVQISQNNSQFQSYLGHAFVTDIKWCKIRVTFTPSSSNAASNAATSTAPTSSQIQEHFNQFGAILRIECFPATNCALITFENYTFAQAAVSLGVHENVLSTGYDASCCYEFEAAEQPNNASLNLTGPHSANSGRQLALSGPHGFRGSHHGRGGGGDTVGPLDERRIFVSSLSYSTTDATLGNVFSQYGDLDDCTVVMDKMTMKSKGFGFVVFKTVNGASNALRQPDKFIDGRRTRSWLAAQGNQFRRR